MAIPLQNATNKSVDAMSNRFFLSLYLGVHNILKGRYSNKGKTGLTFILVFIFIKSRELKYFVLNNY